MLGRLAMILALSWSGASLAATVRDATGRTVTVPDHVTRVLPAGPPAALLLEAVAPDLILGWPSPVRPEARALLAPSAAALPQVPRLTGREDVADKIAALHPDLILDYGTVSSRYSELARTTQQRTGVPTVLFDGALAKTPAAIRTVGTLLHREARAEVLARFLAGLLAVPPLAGHQRVLVARGDDGLVPATAESDLGSMLTQLGWQVVVPAGPAPTSIAAIRYLDPDVIVFSDPTMRTVLADTAAWRDVRAVRDGHAYVAPGLPFGWLEEPPSINRLLGFAWLGGREPGPLAASFNEIVYGHVLSSAQRDALVAGVPRVQP